MLPAAAHRPSSLNHSHQARNATNPGQQLSHATKREHNNVAAPAPQPQHLDPARRHAGADRLSPANRFQDVFERSRQSP